MEFGAGVLGNAHGVLGYMYIGVMVPANANRVLIEFPIEYWARVLVVVIPESPFELGA